MTKKSYVKSKKTQTRKKRYRISHKKHNKTNKVRIKNNFTHMDFNSNDGILTSVWGPALWHYIHSMSFNYPNSPTKFQKSTAPKILHKKINVIHDGIDTDIIRPVSTGDITLTLPTEEKIKLSLIFDQNNGFFPTLSLQRNNFFNFLS